MDLIAQSAVPGMSVEMVALIVAALGGMVSTVSGTWLAVAKTKSDAKIVNLEATVKNQADDIAECRKDRDELKSDRDEMRVQLDALISRFLPGGVP